MADFVDSLFWKGSYESFSNTVTYTSFDVRFLVLLSVSFVLHQWFKWSKDVVVLVIIVVLSLLAR